MLNSKIEVAQKEVHSISNDLIEKVAPIQDEVDLISVKNNQITYDSLLVQIQKKMVDIKMELKEIRIQNGKQC